MKTLLRHVPGLVSTYRQARILASAAYERWGADPARMNDQSILDGDWHFDDPAEQARYQNVLAAVARCLGGSGWGDVLEVGCAEGLFTAELIRRAASVSAYDVSAVACARTMQRLPEVRVRQVDIQRDSIDGPFDVVFLMAVLGYVHGRGKLDRVSAKLAAALRPGGLLVFNELRLHDPTMEDSWWARWLGEGGLQLLTFLDGRNGLRLIDRDLQPRYVVGVYQKWA